MCESKIHNILSSAALIVIDNPASILNCTDLPDAIYIWISNITSSTDIRITKFMDSLSGFVDIFASVNQCSALGPASFIIRASDLQPMHQGNVLVNPLTPTDVIWVQL